MVFSTTSKSMPATVAYALIALGFLLRLPPLPSESANTAINLLKPALCVIGAVYAERRGAMPKLPRLELLGDASYSIYLTHIFTEGATRTIWHWLPIATGTVQESHLRFFLWDLLLVLHCYRIDILKSRL